MTVGTSYSLDQIAESRASATSGLGAFRGGNVKSGVNPYLFVVSIFLTAAIIWKLKK